MYLHYPSTKGKNIISNKFKSIKKPQNNSQNYQNRLKNVDDNILAALALTDYYTQLFLKNSKNDIIIFFVL